MCRRTLVLVLFLPPAVPLISPAPDPTWGGQGGLGSVVRLRSLPSEDGQVLFPTLLGPAALRPWCAWGILLGVGFANVALKQT